MKLVLIHGPPAVGKLSTAKKLAELTGYKLFHNHLTVDLIQPLIGRGSRDFYSLNAEFRLRLLEIAAKRKINMIYTFCYVNREADKRFVRDLIKSVEKYKGKILFVQLTCSKEELYKRVKEESRKSFEKIKSKKLLKSTMKKRDFFSKIPKVKTLSIDNTNLSAKKVAIKIKEHYNL